jgi:hypothetical protein
MCLYELNCKKSISYHVLCAIYKIFHIKYGIWLTNKKLSVWNLHWLLKTIDYYFYMLTLSYCFYLYLKFTSVLWLFCALYVTHLTKTLAATYIHAASGLVYVYYIQWATIIKVVAYWKEQWNFPKVLRVRKLLSIFGKLRYLIKMYITLLCLLQQP